MCCACVVLLLPSLPCCAVHVLQPVLCLSIVLHSIKGPGWDYSAGDDDIDSSEDSGEPIDYYSRLPSAAFRPADLSAIVSCRPGLQELSLCVDPDVYLSSLSRLAALVNLRVERVTDASMRTLAAVTQLTRLSVKLARDVGVTSLVGLTALRRLSQFELDAAAVRLPREWNGVKLSLASVSHGC